MNFELFVLLVSFHNSYCINPIFLYIFGGASGAAVGVGAKHSNVYAFWGEPLAAIAQRIAEVKAAAPPGKDLRFSISLRPILAETEEKAWEKARYRRGQGFEFPILH